MKNIVRYQLGHAIAGKILVFDCRHYKISSQLKHITKSHRGTTGKLYNATCVIDKCFESAGGLSSLDFNQPNIT